jgi:RNA polymerase sigma factor (sigma-70 family)
MVLRVCRRRLNATDAEDVFQAVFMVLARDAGRIARRQSLAGWLFRVALLTSLKLMTRNSRRRMAALPEEGPPGADGENEDVALRELRAILEEELAALPARLRAPLVLCYLEGHSNTEAAAILRCPRGTVDSRLSAARRRLLGRLQRRGVALGTAAAIETILQCDALAASGLNKLIETTVQSAVRYAATRCFAGTGSDSILMLTSEVANQMSTRKLQICLAVAVTLSLLAGGAIGLHRATADTDPAVAQKTEKSAPAKGTAKKPTDKSGTVSNEPSTNRLVQSQLALPSGLEKPFSSTLREFCDFASEKFGVPIRIDPAAFVRMDMGESLKLYDQSVELPIIRGMTFGDALRDVLAQVSINQDRRFPITYRIRDGQILIVPAFVPWHNDLEDASGLSRQQQLELELGEPISLGVEDKPLADVLEDLRRSTGANIVLDNRQKEQAKQPVTATFNDVRLLTALRVLSDICDLRPVAMNNVYYITSRENAARLQKELDKERCPDRPQPAAPFGPLGGLKQPGM